MKFIAFLVRVKGNRVLIPHRVCCFFFFVCSNGTMLLRIDDTYSEMSQALPYISDAKPVFQAEGGPFLIGKGLSF